MTPLQYITTNRTLTWRDAFLVAYCDVWEPKTQSNLVHTQIQNVFCDKTSVFLWMIGQTACKNICVFPPCKRGLNVIFRPRPHMSAFAPPVHTNTVYSDTENRAFRICSHSWRHLKTPGLRSSGDRVHGAFQIRWCSVAIALGVACAREAIASR